MSDIVQDHLNDLRRRVLDHEQAVALGKASPDDAPYTIEELRDAIHAISIDRETAATAEKPKRTKTPAKTVDLTDLI